MVLESAFLAVERIEVGVFEIDIEHTVASGGDIVGYLVGENGFADIRVAEQACQFALMPQMVPEGDGGNRLGGCLAVERHKDAGFFVLMAEACVFVFVGVVAGGDVGGCGEVFPFTALDFDFASAVE